MQLVSYTEKEYNDKQNRREDFVILPLKNGDFDVVYFKPKKHLENFERIVCQQNGYQ